MLNVKKTGKKMFRKTWVFLKNSRMDTRKPEKTNISEKKLTNKHKQNNKLQSKREKMKLELRKPFITQNISLCKHQQQNCMHISENPISNRNHP